MYSSVLVIAGIGLALIVYSALNIAYWERKRYPNGSYPKVDGLTMPGPGAYMAGFIGAIALAMSAVVITAGLFGIIAAVPVGVLMMAIYFRWLTAPI